jgi:hypothetical protein
MPRNGEINEKFGVYRNLCCGSEIVLAERLEFPDCKNHINLITEWKPVADEEIRHVRQLGKNPKGSAA